MPVTSPYRFVPLSRLIVLPEWAPLVSHDQPFADGLCGELALRLTAHTPLCVGGKQDKANEHTPGRVHFFRTPDNKPAIPGSSLKGMLRNVLEIASFARFRQVEDQKLGVRDLSNAQNFYCRAIVRTPVHAGWLRFEGGRWHIQPCAFSRLHQQDLITALNVRANNWTQCSKVRDRYQLIGICPPLRFERSETMPNNPNQWRAQPTANGSLSGRVVVTGQPGPDFTRPRAKKYEFIFHDGEAQTIEVAPEVMSGFRQIHDESEEWTFWTGKLAAGAIPHGIPVFYHTDGPAVRSLGLAMMYKLPYAHSLHEAISHTHSAHLDGTHPDLPDLVFGHLGDEAEQGGQRLQSGLRGRINIGLANVEADAHGNTPEPTLNPPCILNGPKPTFYPAYIRQDGGNAFRTLMEAQAQLSGWKRYPVRERAEIPPIAAGNDNNRVRIHLETVAEGTTFTTRLRFHNLRPVELGAVLWALDFGGRPDHRHALGMGKPFGFGQLSIEITGHTLRTNQPQVIASGDEARLLQACRLEFYAFMDQIVQDAGHDGCWEDCPPLKALLEQAKPARDTQRLEYLPTPQDYGHLKRPGELSEVKQVLHDHSGLNPGRDFDTTHTRAHQTNLAESLEQASAALKRIEKQRKAAQEKAARDALKQDASPEDCLLLEIDELLDACLSGQPTDTQQKKLPSQLNEGHRISVDMTAGQRARLRDQATRAQALTDKKTAHAVKKILRDVRAEGDTEGDTEGDMA